MHNLLPGRVSPAPKRKWDYCPPNTAAVRNRNQSDSPVLAADRLPDVIQPSSFRNVSSCNRCRLRKTRCDQRLPRCQACEKAGARCVGFDAAKKKEIPRSYVFFLEDRVDYLVGVLIAHRIRFKAGAAFDEFAVDPGPENSSSRGSDYERALGNGMDDGQFERHGIATPETYPDFDARDSSLDPEVLSEKVHKRGIRSKESVLHAATDSGSGHTIRESLSAPQAAKPDADCPGLPDRIVAEKLIDCYFEYANPQMPVLSRGEFMELFYRTYSGDDRSPRTLYFLHIVFAVGAGITFDDRASANSDLSARSAKRRRVSSRQCQPLDYHASAIKCLELSLETCDDRFCKLQELQAVILLAHFALLQPVALGPAHLTEVAVRTAVNMDLYCEDETDAGFTDESRNHRLTTHQDRAQDLRRRLWWCAYSLDRMIAPYIGRPFSISDQVVTAEFPSMMDKHIPRGEPRSKHITHHYFKLRQLQSEIHEVLQCQLARAKASNKSKACDNALPSFRSFESFHSWRRDVNRRLDEWKRGIPEQRAGVCFPVVLLELDYWQTINLLYRQNIGVPAKLDEMMPATDPARCSADEAQLEDSVCLKVAEASGKVLQLYRLMHHVRLVNYTYLAAHSIFLAGSSFLFTIWHSPLIRSQLTLNEIDYTLLAGTTILADMADRYPHAGSCRGTLEQMGAATVQMCLSTAEFSSQVNGPRSPLTRTADAGPRSSSGRKTQLHHGQDAKQVPAKRKATQLPRFDMNLEDLLSGRDPNPEPRGPTRQSQFADNHDHADAERSMSPISIPGSSHEQCSRTDMEPLMSLDLLEFDLGASDVLPSVGDGDLYQHTGSDGSIGEAGNLGFSIAADPQQELDRGGYNCVEAFLAVYGLEECE